MRSGEAAADWMLKRVKSEAYPRMCKQFVRLGLDVPSKSGSAAECFRNAKHKHHPDDINDTPAYVPAFYDTGKFGHVVYTLGKDKAGNRLCVSVDVKDTDNDDRREVGVVTLKSLLKWGPFQGWTEDFDGERVWENPDSATKSGTKTHPNSGNPVIPAPDRDTSPKPGRKSITEIAHEVVAGKWGNGAERKENLQRAGYPFAAVQHEVNDLLD